MESPDNSKFDTDSKALDPLEENAPLDLLRLAIRKLSNPEGNDDGALENVISLLQGVEEFFENEEWTKASPKVVSSFPLESTPTSSHNFSNRKKILMENQLDLTEQEMNYYEDLVNNLAEKLEKMTKEKDELQVVSANLAERLQTLSNENHLNFERFQEEFNDLLARKDLEILDLKKQMGGFGHLSDSVISRCEASLRIMNDILPSKQFQLPKNHLSTADDFLAVLELYEQIVSEVKLLFNSKDEQISVQGKRLSMLQETVMEQRARLESLTRENSLLTQEINVVRSSREHTHKMVNDDNEAMKLSDELKVIELTATLRENSKFTQKLSKEVEVLQASVAQKNRSIEDLSNENQSLRNTLVVSMEEVKNLRVVGAKNQTSSKLNQLDQDEQVELLKVELSNLKQKLVEFEESYKLKESELADEKIMNQSLQLLLQKFGEKEEANDGLIAELKRANSELMYSHDEKSQSSQIYQLALSLNSTFAETKRQMENCRQEQNEKFSGLVLRLRKCSQNLNLLRMVSQTHRMEYAAKSESVGNSHQSEGNRHLAEQFEFRRNENYESRLHFGEADDSQTLKSLLLASERKLEQMSGEYARSFAQNSKVFAFLESECLRSRNLCDHLRGVNGKLNIELKKAMLYQVKSKGFEQRIRILLQNEANLSQKCQSLESSLKHSNEEYMKKLRDFQNKDLVQFRASENELHSYHQKIVDLEQNATALRSLNNDLNRKLVDITSHSESEKKILLGKLDLATNEKLMTLRQCSEHEIEIHSLRDKLNQQTSTISQFEMKMSLITHETSTNDLNYSRTMADLKGELQEKLKRLEFVSADLQKTKTKLLETETAMMHLSENYSQVLLKSSEKDEKILQFTQSLESTHKHSVSMSDENSKLRHELTMKSSQLMELTKKVDSLGVALSDALTLRQECEDTARVHQEKVFLLEQQSKSVSLQSKEFQTTLKEREVKITELTESVFALNERNEFLKASLENLKTVNFDCSNQINVLLTRNSELEKQLAKLTSQLAGSEDRYFELELITKQDKEKLQQYENSEKFSRENESTLVNKLRNLGDNLVRLSKMDSSPGSFEKSAALALNNGFFSVWMEVDRVEEIVALIFTQLQQLVEKSKAELKENDLLLSERETLQIKLESLQHENLICRESIETLDKELKMLAAKVISEEEREMKTKKKTVELISHLNRFIHEKEAEIRKQYSELFRSISSISVWEEDELDLNVSISRVSANLRILVSQLEGVLASQAENLSLLKDQHRAETEELTKQLNQLNDSQEQVRAEFRIMQDRERQLSESFSEKEKDLNSAREEVNTLKQAVKEMALNNGELEKEFKSVASLNAELAHSLSEAESICSELRTNGKSLQQQQLELKNALMQAQNQVGVFQQRCSEAETRLENISFSYKRLKSEKEVLEQIRVNLEIELEQISMQAISDGAKGTPLYDQCLFEIEKISSALESVMVLITEQSSGSSVALVSLDQSTSEYDKKIQDSTLKLEKIHIWIRSEIKEKHLLQKKFEILQEEVQTKDSEFAAALKLNERLQHSVAEMEKEIHDKTALVNSLRQELSTRTREHQDASRELNLLQTSKEELSVLRSTLEADRLKQESETKRLENELRLREEVIHRLQEDFAAEQGRYQSVVSEVGQRLQQLEAARMNRDTMLATIHQLESCLNQEQSHRIILQQKLEKYEKDNLTTDLLSEEIQKLHFQIENIRKENTSIISDKLNIEQANNILKRELEITRNKAQSLEQHVVLVQQEKDLYQDEINETRRKIQLAKESFEVEKVQRLKSEATTAALKIAQDEDRKRFKDINVFHSQSSAVMPSEENDKKELKLVINKLKSENEEKTRHISRMEHDRGVLQAELAKVKEQLTVRTAELKDAQVYSSNLRSEGRNVRRKLTDMHFALKEMLHLLQLDSHSVLEKVENDLEFTDFNHSDREPQIKLEEALGIPQLSNLVFGFKQAFVTFRNNVKEFKQKADEYVHVLNENRELLQKAESLESEKQVLEHRYTMDVQMFHAQIKGLSSHDLQSVQLLQQITALESSLKREKEQKELLLAEITDLTNEVNLVSTAKESHLEYEGMKREILSFKNQLRDLEMSREELQKEVEELHHQRVIVNATMEDMERKLSEFSGGDIQQIGGDGDENWEIVRYKTKLQGLSKLCKIYRTGLFALYEPGRSYGAGNKICPPWLEWIQRDLFMQGCFEEEIHILDARIDELQLKLRQYRKYGLEVRKQFEEILKSIHRVGKQPTMEIAIRQIEQLRTQLEESQDFIASIQEEANEDRLYYRHRLNALFSKVGALEKIKDLSLVAVKKIDAFCRIHSVNDEELEEIIAKLISSGWEPAENGGPEHEDHSSKPQSFKSKVDKPRAVLRVTNSRK